MAKEKIPVYDICSLNKDEGADYLVERFSSYLNRHDPQLHLPHRHSFYHLVLFTKGSGSHQIDFTRFKVKPFQIYFMIPGQVHSWYFEGEADGYTTLENRFYTTKINDHGNHTHSDGRTRFPGEETQFPEPLKMQMSPLPQGRYVCRGKPLQAKKYHENE